MDASKSYSSASMRRIFGPGGDGFRGFGAALRAAFQRKEAVIPFNMDEKNQPAPSELRGAIDKVNEASTRLETVAKLSVNPWDLKANQDGIAEALRRLSEDV